jgi:hypothetical protein
MDYKDPNYDSESLDNGDIHLAAIIPEMSDEEIQVRELTNVHLKQKLKRNHYRKSLKMCRCYFRNTWMV